MDRVAVPELEDYPWFPVPLRDALTGFLRVSAEVLGLSELAAPLVLDAMRFVDTPRLVDLCSGGGGPVIELGRRLERDYHRRVEVVLTDLYPNVPAFERAERELPGRLTGVRTSTDATRVPTSLTGVRTIFNAFHHLPPAVAEAVLVDARDQRQPILTFEIVERSPQGALAVLSTPLAVAAFMPFVKPRSAAALALTYGVPVVPAAVLWDGFASCMRAYSVPELQAMAERLGTPDYRFRVERRRVPGRPLFVTSIIGCPTR